MKKWAILLGTVMIVSMVSGCTSNTEASENNAQSQNTTSVTQETTDSSADETSDEVQQDNADIMGKVKSINGNTITLYKSSMDPAEMMNSKPEGEGQTPPDGEVPTDGEASAGGQPLTEGETPPEPKDGDGMGEPMGMDDMFTDETTDIEVTTSTSIVSQSQGTESPIAIADLKEGDIVTVWLTSDTQEAEKISLGGGMMGGMGGPQGDAQEGATTEGTSDSGK